MSAMMSPQGSGANKPEAKIIVPVVQGFAVTNGGMRVAGGIVKGAFKDGLQDIDYCVMHDALFKGGSTYDAEFWVGYNE